MRGATSPGRALLALALLLAAAAPGTAAEPEGSEAANAARHYFTDVELVDQRGEPVRLYSDLLEGKVVVINTVFTACTGLCPILSSNLAEVQEHAGERVGREVHLLSISVDPENDTPAALAALAERHGAREGWYFLTGEPANVELALRKLGQFTADPEAHQGILILGNEPTGLWKKAFGLAGAEAVIEVFDSVLHDRGVQPGPGRGPAPGGSR